MVARLHNQWHPQIVYDVHQQGPGASRMFVPPWLDPIDPNVDPILMQMGEAGGVEELIWKDRCVREGIYLYKGTVTNKFVSELFGIPYRDLNLLMASRI